MYKIGKEEKLYNLSKVLSEEDCKDIYVLSQPSTCGDLDTNKRFIDLQHRSSRETKIKLAEDDNGFQLDIVNKFEEKYNIRVKPHLHKLVIYSKGDHFKEHVDGPEWYGTVIGILQSNYTGGNLEIAGEHITDAALGGIKFYAFKSNTPHSISKVTSGYRVVIIWKLSDPIGEIALDKIKRTPYLSMSDLFHVIIQVKERQEYIKRRKCKGIKVGKWTRD